MTQQIYTDRAAATAFWDNGGLSVDRLDPNIGMSAQAMVDAALAGFARGWLITIPSLQDEAFWTRDEQARQVMMPHLDSDAPAERYQPVSVH